MTPSRRSFLKASARTAALLAVGSPVLAALPDLRPSWVRAIDEAIADPEGWELTHVVGPANFLWTDRIKDVEVPVPALPCPWCYLKRTNDRAVGDAEPGTLLVVGYRMIATANGPRAGTLTICYRERQWNQMIDPKAERWVEYRDAKGQPLYPSIDFAAVLGGA